MKKNILFTLLVIALLTLGSFTFAEDGITIDPEILEIVQTDVDETNEIIDEMIQNAVCDSKLIVKKYDHAVRLAQRELDGTALQERLDSLYMNKEVQINNLIDNLVDETNAVAHAMFQRAADLGVLVICELVPVEIDGRIVMIDPLRVVGS